MKKVLAIIALALTLSITASAQKSVTRQGNTFSLVSTKKAAQEEKTQYTWQDSKGNTYPIYISASGSCYVKRISKKSGKEYKQYLGKEVSAQICKELGREYKSK